MGKNTTNNLKAHHTLKCVMCGDSADYSAERGADGAPIWGLRDDGGAWGGASPCGDWHRWKAAEVPR